MIPSRLPMFIVTAAAALVLAVLPADGSAKPDELPVNTWVRLDSDTRGGP